MGSESLGTALAARPILLDGGLSNELEAQGQDLTGELWTARMLRDRPEAVRDVHRAYYAAGAEIAITASYQATYEGFARLGIGAVQATDLLARSVTLAREAAADFPDRELWVAASIGPYGAMLADGSEYRGRYGLTVPELVRFHRPRLEALASAGPDVLAVETIPDALEAEAILLAMDGLDIPAWFSYSSRDTRTCAGQPLEDAFAVVKGSPQVIAAGVNCVRAEEVAAAVEIATGVTGLPGVAYPNSGGAWDATARRWAGDPTDLTSLLPSWLAAGARLVGGCCRVGPERIAAFARVLAG
jgi:homocysteine S-methyltransferase